MIEEEDWLTVDCSVCGSPHLNSPDISFPVCEDCMNELYEDE